MKNSIVRKVAGNDRTRRIVLPTTGAHSRSALKFDESTANDKR